MWNYAAASQDSRIASQPPEVKRSGIKKDSFLDPSEGAWSY